MSTNGKDSVDKSKRRPKGQQSRSPVKGKTVGTKPTTTTPAIGKRIRVYRNGDPFHKGINVVLNMRHAHDINSFLDAISERIGLVSGVKKLYSLNGNQIKSTNALENNKEYVASSAGGFMPLNYGAAYRQQQTAFLPKKEESSFSLASSKRSLPTRMSRSSTELRSTSRDLSVRSMNSNGIHSAKSNMNGQKAEKPTTKRSKSLVTRKTTVEKTKPTITHPHNKKDEVTKKKRVKKSPSSVTSNKSKVEQNGKSKSPPKRKIKKKKSVTKELEVTEDHKNPAIVVQEQNTHDSEHEDSHLSSSATSGVNRPSSRHSSRASKRPETTESRKSSRRESVDHTNESRRESEVNENHITHESRENNENNEESDHHTENSRPHSHHSIRSTARSSSTKNQSPRDEENHHESEHGTHENSPREEENHHQHGTHENSPRETDEDEESEKEDKEHQINHPRQNVPLDAL